MIKNQTHLKNNLEIQWVNNVWYKFCKDYVKPIIDAKPTLDQIDPEETSIENQTDKLRDKHQKLAPSQMMNLTPDLLKAGPGQSGQYLDAQHRLNMPQDDNFIGFNEYNQ